MLFLNVKRLIFLLINCSLMLLLCFVAVVDDTSELHPYPVINPMSVNNNYSKGAKESTDKSELLEPDTGSTIELVLPSNLFPSASSTDDHKTDDSAATNAKVGVSSTNGNDNEPPVTTNNLMQ